MPPLWRVPLLLLGFAGLLFGTLSGLARLGVAVPAAAASAAALHGPLMIVGFFGVVIALERAVAIGRLWAYLGPLAAGLGGAAAIAGAPQLAAPLFLVGSLVLFAASVDVVRRQAALFTLTIAAGALALVVGNALWARGWPVREVVAWWLAFLILTIAGERLELTRLLPPSPGARRVFVLTVIALVVGLLGAQFAWGARVFGAALLALAAWLGRQDVARRNVRQRGLPRFIAVCLLSGYVWLAVGGAVLLAAGALAPGSPSYDAALHALALGFVFSMVFGHAPIIVPAVLRVRVPYTAAFYLSLVLLQASVLVRLAGDAAGRFDWTRAGALGNALAIAVFILVTLRAALRGRGARDIARPNREL
ncbi:MAG TPA: hypothetical protein VF814_14210 [Casimicrobiaceae bacterium]